jgi:hypothetical protein
VSPLELVDDRFEKLAAELRAGRPAAPEALRARVLALAPPPPPRRLQLNPRQIVPAVAFAGIAVAVGAATVIGVVHGSHATSATSAKTETVVHGAPQSQAAGKSLRRTNPTVFGADKSAAAGAFAPSATRLQQYDASLGVRVKDQTRSLGGYVVSAQYSAPGKAGTSSLALRIPIQRVQAAIAAFSAYGTLVSQRISLKDLQQKFDALGIRIRRLRARIAGGEPQAQLDRDKALLRRLTRQHLATWQHAQLASVALTMVVAAQHKHAAGPPSRFHRTIDDAGSVLVREVELLLYALLVAGPLLLLGGAAILASRSLRRRSDRQLLERT